jgi:hypothetical protein
MFSEKQINSIKILSSMTIITNKCFEKCVNINENENKLNNEEIKCLQKCSDSYLKLRNFIEKQLFQDYESILRKNKTILAEQT